MTALGNWPTGGISPTVPALRPEVKVQVVANGASGNVASYVVDASGTLTPAAGSPFSTGSATYVVTNVSWHPTKPFVYATNTNNEPAPSSIAAYAVDPVTAVLTPIGSPVATGGSGATVGAVDRSGRFFYASNHGSNSIAAFTIDQTTGALTAVPGSPFASKAQPIGVTFDPSGKYLYAANSGAASVTAYAIDATTGALTEINTAAAGASPSFAVTYGRQ
jgi:6-phosphogluconolactonase (cycloisomerase 2 family)